VVANSGAANLGVVFYPEKAEVGMKEIAGDPPPQGNRQCAPQEGWEPKDHRKEGDFRGQKKESGKRGHGGLYKG